MSSQQGWQRIAAMSQLRDDEAFPAKLGEVPIVLYRLDGQVFAIDDVCTHEFALLSQGFIEGRAVELRCIRRSSTSRQVSASLRRQRST
jgi:nitrite reductase/ring-hydroxylating ferredoxin subunit